MPRKVRQIPDCFTPEEAGALVDAAPTYPTRMAFRIMLKTGLRVSEALALRRVDLRLDQDPPIISVQADSPGNKAKKGREVPVPADLLESLGDLASFHSKDRHRRAAGPAHPPCPHPGDERRELPPQAQQGERRVPSFRRSRGKIGRTANAVSS